METYYKFLREIDGKIKSDNGNVEWEIGEWKNHDRELKLCKSGFHCSKRIGQAFSFVQGEILAEVEVKGKYKSDADKEVWSDMRIIKAWKWQKKDSVAIAIFSAELCLNNFEKVYPDDKRPREAIEAAKKWLENPTKENESAAEGLAKAAWTGVEGLEGAAWWAAEAVWAVVQSQWAAKEGERAGLEAARALGAATRAEGARVEGLAEAEAEVAGERAAEAEYKKIYDYFDKQLTKLEPYEQ